MTPPTITIGQLAAYVGVTTRAIRHYHAQGLLPEPARDASGYRRYDAKAVVDLVRIRTLAEAGVPLARVGQLLAATPDEFVSSVTTIDRNLQDRIKDLEAHRDRLAKLSQGERLFLADVVVQVLDEMRSIGVSERTVQIERDAWILVSALSPDQVLVWAEGKKRAFEDPDFQRLYLLCDAAIDWAPDDPRLQKLAAFMADWSAKNPNTGGEVDQDAAVMVAVVQLMNADIAAASPAWARLASMVPERPDP